MNQKLPVIETPEEAKAKMKESYLSFIQSCSVFVTMADFYSQEENTGHMLPNNFIETFNMNIKKLREGSLNDFVYIMASSCALHLGFIEEARDNLNDYFEILKGQDETLSDYDKACDLLVIKDTFVDLKHDLDETNKIIKTTKSIETHPNNKNFDLNKVLAEKINPEA